MTNKILHEESDVKIREVVKQHIMAIMMLLLLMLLDSRWNATLGAESTDSLALTRDLMDKGEYKRANSLASSYVASHPYNIYGLWMQGKTAFYCGDVKMACSAYERAIDIDYTQMYMVLDYCRMLVEVGEFDRAEMAMVDIEDEPELMTEVLLMKGRIFFWQNKLGEAYGVVSEVLATNPTNPNAIALAKEIEDARAWWNKTSLSVVTDNQPRLDLIPRAEAGKYISTLLSPRVAVQQNRTDIGGRRLISSRGSIGNRSYFHKVKLSVDAELGATQFPAGKKVGVVGNLNVEKRLPKGFSAGVEAGRKPYLYTTSSLNTSILESYAGMYAGVDRGDGWNGRLGVNRSFFANNNHITSISAWMLSPALKWSLVELRVGYGYSSTNAKESRYVQCESTDKVLEMYYFSESIAAEYNPIYTPSHIQIHNAIAAVLLKPSRNLTISTAFCHGVFARSNVPYLYLDVNDKKQAYVARGESRTKLNPMEFNANVSYKFSSKLNLGFEYRNSDVNTYYRYQMIRGTVSFKL